MNRFVVIFALLGLLVLGGIFAVISMITGNSLEAEPSEFPVAIYYESPERLKGNQYLIEAQVDNLLKMRDGVGRLVEIKLLGDRNDALVPLFIPDSVEKNFNLGERYRIEVVVNQDGLLETRKLKRF